jgi:hypothetical protein
MGFWNIDNFFRTVSKHTTLTVDGKQELSLFFRKAQLPKGYILVKENSICNSLYFVDSGLRRTFYTRERYYRLD